MFQDFERGAARLWMKIIIEGVDPQQHFPLFGGWMFVEQCRPLPSRPSPKIQAGKSRKLTLWRETQNQSQQMPQSWNMAEKVCDARRERSKTLPTINNPVGISSKMT